MWGNHRLVRAAGRARFAHTPRMNRHRRTGRSGRGPGLGLLLALALLAAAVGTPAAAAPSGLHGHVTRGPTQPVCRAGQPCTEPAAHLTLVFRQPGRAPVTTRTDARGNYRVALPPGTYRVRTDGRGPGTGLWPARVRVRQGHDDRRDFSLDTGIR